MGNSKKQNHSEEQFTSTQNFLYYLHNTIMRINEDFCRIYDNYIECGITICYY